MKTSHDINRRIIYGRMPAKEASNAILVFGALCLLTFILNFSALSGSWRWDDPAILLHIHKFSAFSDFLDPEVWQQFSPSNLTPWLSVSFEVDLALFGVNTKLFYVHHLIALSAVALALYYLLVLWTRKAFAIFGSCLFLMGAPSLVVAQQLMTRHYIEGMVFSLLSLIFFVIYLRQKNISLCIVSGLFYLASVTAKEIYVPLVILIIFIPENDIRTRLRAAAPHMAIALLYILWRGYMLDSLSGGYVDSSDYLLLANLEPVLTSFLTIPGLLFDGYWPVVVTIYCIVAAMYAITSRSKLLLSLLVALLILIPMIPLVSFPGIQTANRYLFLPWLAICFSLAFYGDRAITYLNTTGRLRLGYGIYVLCSLTVLFSVLSATNIRAPVAEVGKEFDTQANFIWQNDNRTAFVPSDNILASYWFVTGLMDFKTRLLEGATSPIPVVDGIYLNSTIPRLWTYDASCYCMQESGESITDMMNAHTSRTLYNVPLSLNFDYQGGYFSWEFGPYDEGQYHVISDVVGVIPVSRSGRLRVNLEEGTPFYLRYTSPSGWITYSQIHYVYNNRPLTRWQRE